MLAFCWLILLAKICPAQSYGLGFASHETVADKRTGLDLFPDSCLNVSDSFSLSFDLSFLKDKKDYFGYIFRIIEGNKSNFDLLFDGRNSAGPNTPDDHFKFIVGDHYTKINFSISEPQVFDNWTNIRIDFNATENKIVLKVNNRIYTEYHVGLKPAGYFKFLFGCNNYRSFKTHDNPPFKLRNVKLDIRNGESYFWPLNEDQGTVATDINDELKSNVVNPLWIRALYQSWRPIASFELSGGASCAFNAREDLLYIINKDSIYTLNIKKGIFSAQAYKAGHPNVHSSSGSAYNNSDDKLYNYFIDRKTTRLTTYDFSKSKWSNNFDYIAIVDHLHANKFFSPVDTSLYVLGGYGQFEYKNSVDRFQLAKGTVQHIKWKGDNFAPRYLAALGVADSGKTAYILGGYGSHTGQQVLNPQSYNDLLRFDVRSHTFKKVYELKQLEQGMSFTNSMVINEKEQTFAVLAFSNFRYHGWMQLISGSLKKPGFHWLADKIPYDFIDNHSFADLFYSPGTKSYVAVTIVKKDQPEKTRINIFTLAAPALPIDNQIQSAAKTAPRWLWPLAAGLAIIATVVFGVWMLLRKAKGRGKHTQQLVAGNKNAIADEVIDVAEPNEGERNAIFLFGDLKLCTSDGEDIYKNFTSLIKELFLVILINSVRSKRGVSPEKLLELFWFDKSEDSAKNNRSANISRLKTQLSRLQNVTLSKSTGNWKIEIDHTKVYVDYFEFLRLTGKKGDYQKSDIIALMYIVQRGNFLADVEYQWLDHIKSEVSNEIINIFINYTNTVSIEEDPEFMIRIANCVFNFDPVNEEAMLMKCKALIRLGKHSLAKSTFMSFTKEYQDLYGEKFKTDFLSMVEHH